MYMANGTNTTNATLADQYVYHVKLLKLINGTTVSNIQVIKKTTAQIETELPSTVQISSMPLSGQLKLTCPGPTYNDIAVNPYLSNDITLDQDPYSLARRIYFNCSGTYDKLEVWRAYSYPYKENGISYYVRFVGMPGEHPLMKVTSSADSPLTGNWEAHTTRVVNASTNIFYPAIPFEMLRTYETQPQVIVQVGDYPAVCKNLTCDFHYVAPEGEVTAFTYTASSRQLQLTGTDLPVNSSMIDYVEFAHSRCTVSSASATSLTCVLDYEPVCGDHLPKLVAVDGQANNSAALTAETITCTISSVVPTTELNLLGGDNLTISGTQFPWNLETSVVDITFNDAQATKCVPQVSSSTTLVCLTGAFDKQVSSGQTVTVTVVING